LLDNDNKLLEYLQQGQKVTTSPSTLLGGKFRPNQGYAKVSEGFGLAHEPVGAMKEG